MPELPEVETLSVGVWNEALVGHRDRGQSVSWCRRCLKGTWPILTCWHRRSCKGAQIESVARRGKHLIFTLDCGYYLLLHLKMRGQLLVWSLRVSLDEKYLAAALQFEDGRELRFHDMWRWGEMRLMTPEELATHPGLMGMGPEPFSAEWTPHMFARSLAKRPRTARSKRTSWTKPFVAGVGNILR